MRREATDPVPEPGNRGPSPARARVGRARLSWARSRRPRHARWVCAPLDPPYNYNYYTTSGRRPHIVVWGTWPKGRGPRLWRTSWAMPPPPTGT